MTINNVAYSWAMIELTSPALTGSSNANPIILSGVQGIKWNRKKKMETNYGLGGEPVNRGFGNTEYTASITMDYNTQVQLRALKGSLMELGQFDLIVSWSNKIATTEGSIVADDDWSTETVTLKGCVFNEDGLEVSQDDTNITKEFDLNPFTIVMSTK